MRILNKNKKYGCAVTDDGRKLGNFTERRDDNVEKKGFIANKMNAYSKIFKNKSIK